MPKREPIKLDFRVEPEDEIMPFGKHEGEHLGDLPNTYIEWCLQNFDDEERADLLESLQKVLDGRASYIRDEHGR